MPSKLPNSSGDPNNAWRSHWRRRILLTVKTAIVVMVAWFIWDAVDRARADLNSQSFALSDVRPSWLMLSALLYLAGMIPMWLYWHEVLLALGASPRRFSSCRAFFIGHLGKYVPGKALVVVLRASLVRGPGTTSTVATIAVFVETLTMMAVGAFLAGAIMAVVFSSERYFQLLALGLMLATGIPTLPPIFRRVVGRLQTSKFAPELRLSLDGLTYGVLLRGWIFYAIGWCFLGASLWATLKSTGSDVAGLADSLARLTATSALAVVAGFLSLIPGGLGVREVILDRLLAPEFGVTQAIVATILLRLTWLMTELVISITLYVCGSRASE